MIVAVPTHNFSMIAEYRLMSLKDIVEDTNTQAGRVFDLFIECLIVFSLITFSIETLPNLSENLRFWLYAFEVVTVSIFTIEYALRIIVADHKLRFLFSFYGLIDFLAIAPFYISTGIDLRAVRIFRLFRVFRVFKLFRYTRAIQRFKRAFLEIRDELTLYGMATAFFIFISSVGIYYFEGAQQPAVFGSVFHCLWWSVVTLTTVGYGDCYPITAGGRIFTSFLILIGIGVVAVPTGLFASALTTTKNDNAVPGRGNLTKTPSIEETTSTDQDN